MDYFGSQQEEIKKDLKIINQKGTFSETGNIVIVKCELKEESTLNVQTDDDDSDREEWEEEDDDSDLELAKVKERLKAKKHYGKTKQKLTEENSDQEDQDREYECFVVKTYTSTSVKDEPVEDFKTIFKENNLEYEKQKYYQRIMENIIDNSEQVKLKELQSQYITKLREATNIEIFSCVICSYQTMNMTNLKCHLLVMHNKKTMHKMFRCKTCNYEHDYRITIKKHLGVHQSFEPEAIFKCEQCTYIGPSKRSLKTHIKKQHTEYKTPVCDLCGYVSKDFANLKKHMGTHRVAGSHRYKCFKCDHEVANKMKMARHLLKVHQINNQQVQKLQDLKCTHCDYKTDNLHRLRQHELVHKNPDEIQYFYCDKCSFKCKLKHGLKKHMVAVHVDKNERVYSQMCDKCSYKCDRPSMLKLHMLSHMDKSEIDESELHKCPHCPFMGKTKGNLKSHMYLHSEKSFKCDLCGFETKRQKNYKEHRKLHMKSSEVKLYKCEFCIYQTKFKPCLVNHMKQGDHTGKNLKHIPHKFRIENADNPDFDPTEVRFGPPKKYPKYPKKDKTVDKNDAVKNNPLQQQANQSNILTMPATTARTYGWDGLEQNNMAVPNAAGDIFFNYMAGNSRFRY